MTRLGLCFVLLILLSGFGSDARCDIYAMIEVAKNPCPRDNSTHAVILKNYDETFNMRYNTMDLLCCQMSCKIEEVKKILCRQEKRMIAEAIASKRTVIMSPMKATDKPDGFDYFV
ncbi:hypothetical protein QR680_000497 [Steinernema hermaphroditum]|uniref:Insulin-like domain-containing protein n=1 Tax=Steinernema hermaphroditum TaxID=289476 RepID=A0AA39GXL4_9BILA|nr:hypothetical protein QR680_000497 [Steinernema hermaphroditum]